jgi:hypothetical protein
MRRASCRLARHPPRDIGLGLALHVKAHFLGEVGIDACTAEQRAPEREESMKESHGSCRRFA